MSKPTEDQVVDVRFMSKHAEGWMPAYWGTAFSSSEPNDPHNSKRCWRYCNTQGEVNCDVLYWRKRA